MTRHVTGNLPWADVAELRRPVPTLQDVPPFLRAGVRRALVFALRAIRDADAAENAHVTPARAWSLFLLMPRMMARPGAGSCLSASTGTSEASGSRCWPPRKGRGPQQAERRKTPMQHSASGARPRAGSSARVKSAAPATCSRVAPWRRAMKLHGPAKRPAQARTPVPDELLHCQPEEPALALLAPLRRRCARPGAAPRRACQARGRNTLNSSKAMLMAWSCSCTQHPCWPKLAVPWL